MTVLFFIAGATAVIASALAVTRPVPVHSLLWMIITLVSVSVVFETLGNSFAAALEVIVYAGAIAVLLLFAVLLLDLGVKVSDAEKATMAGERWIGPMLAGVGIFGVLGFAILSPIFEGSLTTADLTAQLARMFTGDEPMVGDVHALSPQEIGRTLYLRYGVVSELATAMLLAGLVGAFHLGRHTEESP